MDKQQLQKALQKIQYRISKDKEALFYCCRMASYNVYSFQALIDQNFTYSQIGLTCYAHAVASAINYTEMRIIGRIPEKHDALAFKIIAKYGNKGANTYNVLKQECTKRNLLCEYINDQKARQITEIDFKYYRPVVATFRLSKEGWDSFSQQIKQNNGTINKKIPSGNQGHAILIIGNKENKWRVKNSWGFNWGFKGDFQIQFGTIEMKFIDVYFTIANLTEKDKENFEKHKKGELKQEINFDFDQWWEKVNTKK